MSRFGSAYKRALKLLPTAYHNQYAEPMAQMLEDMLVDQSSWIAKARVWLRAMLDLLVTATYQYTQGGAIMNQLPTYAKGSILASAILLAPFFIFVAMNAISPLHGLGKQIGYISIFVLPVIALLLSLATVATLAARKRFSFSIKQLRLPSSSWGILAVPLLALMIVGFAFGHDSAHCATSGSISKITHCVSHS